MAVLYATNATNAFNTNPPVKGGPETGGGSVRVLRDTVTYATQTTSDTIVLGGKKLPIGATVLYVTMQTTVTTGSATLALGITGTVAKYKAAGAVTTVDVPQIYGVTAGTVATTTEEQLFLTIGGASLPGSGTLIVNVFYVVD